MLLRTIARVVFVCVFVPVWLARKVFRSSPFGPRAHRADSAWDR